MFKKIQNKNKNQNKRYYQKIKMTILFRMMIFKLKNNQNKLISKMKLKKNQK